MWPAFLNFGAVRRSITKSLRTRGIWGTAAFSMRLAYNAAWALAPDRCRARRRYQAAEREFDLLHNVDTAGKLSLARLVIHSVNWEHGVVYQAIDEAHGRAVGLRFQVVPVLSWPCP